MHLLAGEREAALHGAKEGARGWRFSGITRHASAFIFEACLCAAAAVSQTIEASEGERESARGSWGLKVCP